MTPTERAKLEARYWELEAQLQDLYAGKVTQNDPATTEALLLQEQDEIEYLLGLDRF